MSSNSSSFAVFDIDGVLADVRHRLHYLEQKPKNWEAFFAAAAVDPPLFEGIELARTLSSEHTIAYLTGRPSRLRRATMAWFDQHQLPEGRLLMRRSGDYRPARLAKLELLQDLAGELPVHVLVDDDAQVVAALRQAGFAVMHATWGAAGPVLHQAQEREGRT